MNNSQKNIAENNRKARVSRIAFVLCFLLCWQLIYYLEVFPRLLFPSLGMILRSLWDSAKAGDLLYMTTYSLKLILKGMAIGIGGSILFSVFSSLSFVFYSIYNMIVSIFDLIPGVALIPLTILWFGVGEVTIIVIVIHSVIWPMSRNILDGFSSIPKVFIETGKNIGLSGFSLAFKICIPAACAYIFSGIRVGWARAWRAVISTEMIFGTTSAGAGIGWFIYMKRTNLDIAGVFASLIIIIVIGLVIEYGIFSVIERHTVRKWGMVR